MISETIVLLANLEDLSKHRLSKHFTSRLALYFHHRQYFYEPLHRIFSKVIPYDFIKRMTEIGVKGINEEIIELVRKEHPKYVFWISGGYPFLESTFDRIREEGSIIIGWFGDDITKFDDYSKWWIPHLDYFITGDTGAIAKYQELGARVIRTIHGAGTPVDVNWSKIEKTYNVSFIGSKSKFLREQYIDKLKERDIPIALFGSGWIAGYIPYKEMIDIINSSKINLCFSRVGHGNKMAIKGRVTEVCLAGGFLLTEYVPGIENYFEIDKEIVCFHNTEEMIDKVTYYLNHDEERRAIAQAGWKRAVSEYTPFHMLSRLFCEFERDIAAEDKRTRPRELKMPRWVRKRFSTHYSNWLKAFSLENYKDLSKDAFALSISYNRLNIWAWCYYLTSFLPYPVRLSAYKFGRSGYHAFRRFYVWARHPS